MIDHTGIHVTDLARSRAFYTQVLKTLGHGICQELPDAVGYGPRPPSPGDDPGGGFWIAQAPPFVPRSHVAFRARDAEQVRAFHRAALAAGGTDNGAPGLRPQYHPGCYAAFVLDPDGYNIEAVWHGAAGPAPAAG